MGRHFNGISIEDAQSFSRAHGEHSIVCGMCPKWKDSYCSVFAKFMTKIHLACKYGKLVMRAAKQKEKWRVKK